MTVSTYIYRQRGGGFPHRKNAFHEWVLHFEPGAVGVETKIHPKLVLSMGDLSPPPVFAYCEWSQTGWWEGLWTRLWPGHISHHRKVCEIWPRLRPCLGIQDFEIHWIFRIPNGISRFQRGFLDLLSAINEPHSSPPTCTHNPISQELHHYKVHSACILSRHVSLITILVKMIFVPDWRLVRYKGHLLCVDIMAIMS